MKKHSSKLWFYLVITQSTCVSLEAVTPFLLNFLEDINFNKDINNNDDCEKKTQIVVSKIGSFILNQFSVSGVHFGVKQYGKFNIYLGLVNGVSWYFGRCRISRNLFLYSGMKIEYSIPFMLWKFFAVFKNTKGVQPFPFLRRKLFYFWCPSIYLFNLRYKYLNIDFLNLPHIVFWMSIFATRSMPGAFLKPYNWLLMFFPAVTFDLTKLINKNIDLYLINVYEISNNGSSLNSGNVITEDFIDFVDGSDDKSTEEYDEDEDEVIYDDQDTNQDTQDVSQNDDQDANQDNDKDGDQDVNPDDDQDINQDDDKDGDQDVNQDDAQDANQDNDKDGDN